MQLFVIRNNADAAAASVAGPLIRFYPAGMHFFRGFIKQGFVEFVKLPMLSDFHAIICHQK